MKLMFFAAALTISASSYANYCQVNMVDTYRNNRVITTFSSYDMNEGCKESMKQCRLEIHKRNLRGQADCLRLGSSQRPVPSPRPVPVPSPRPRPVPVPQPDYSSAQRHLNHGEVVIYNRAYHTVVGVNFNGLYTLRSSHFNTQTYNVYRENIAVTNGCSRLGLCTSDLVYNVSWVTPSAERVIGISYDERFVTQTEDLTRMIKSDVERHNLAETKGCVYGRHSQVCVNNVVIDLYNNYHTVVGVQVNGSVVTEAHNILRTKNANVDPSGLVVTR